MNKTINNVHSVYECCRCQYKCFPERACNKIQGNAGNDIARQRIHMKLNLKKKRDHEGAERQENMIDYVMGVANSVPESGTYYNSISKKDEHKQNGGQYE